MRTTGTAPARRWGPLTAELRNTKSPVTLFIKQCFPHVKQVQQRYRDSVGPLAVAGGDAHPGTLGTAFDWAVRFLVHPQPSLDLALIGVVRRVPQIGIAAIEMGERLGVMPGRDALGDGLGVGRFDGPAAGSTVDDETLLRGCWALALLTEVYRVGGIVPGSPLCELDPDRVRAADLLALASPSGVTELEQLCQLARTALLPHLAVRRGPWAIGPTFDGSKLMKADADFIAAGLLVEMKTSLGDKRADGSRRAGLDGPTLQQMLGYLLLDFPDEFAIKDLGLYAARYGHLTTWRLPELLQELAGHPVDLTAERAAFHALLLGRSP